MLRRMREEGGLGEEPKSARDWNLGASAAEDERDEQVEY